SGWGFIRLEFAGGLWIGIVTSTALQDLYAGDFQIMSSTDAQTWTLCFTGVGYGRYVTVANGRLMALSSMGWGLESDPLLSLEQNGPGALVVRRAGGISAVLESSEDLLRWQMLTTLPSGDPVQSWTDPAKSSAMRRFYRARIP